MKKLLFTAAIFVATGASAQKLYIKAGLGFAIPQASQTLDVGGTMYNGNAIYFPGAPGKDSITSFSMKKASFSSGFKGAIGAGYHFNNHVAVELYLDLGLSTTQYTSTQDTVTSPSGAYLANDKMTQKSQFPIMLIPAVVLKTDNPKFNVYGRIGLVLPLKNQVSMELQSEYIAFIPNTEVIKGTMKTRFNVGFTGAFGGSYALGKGANFWGEVGFTSLSLFAKEMEITEHSGGATNAYPLEGSTISYGFSGQPGSPVKPSFSMPYSNMAFMIGVNFDIK